MGTQRAPEMDGLFFFFSSHAYQAPEHTDGGLPWSVVKWFDLFQNTVVLSLERAMLPLIPQKPPECPDLGQEEEETQGCLSSW
jgi:hypothetical protein